MADKIVKNVIIAKSGIYEYRANEGVVIAALSIIDNPERKDIYKIYRPALVLAENASKFSRLPLYVKPDFYNHPAVFPSPENWDKYGVGLTGDTVGTEWDAEMQEVALSSTLTIVGETGIEAYESGINEVSPGYDGKFVYAPSKTTKGEDYDIIMESIDKVDHLVITRKGRSGVGCKIADTEGEKEMPKIKTGLLWQIKKALGIGKASDADLGSFREMITDVITNRNSLADQELTAKVAELKNFIAELPDTPDKEMLSRYIDELPVLKSKPDEMANGAIAKIADLFEKLDTEAMKDKPAEAPKVPAETAAPATPEATPEKPKDAEITPATAPAENAEQKEAYTVEELKQGLTKMLQLLEGLTVDCNTSKDADPEIKETTKEEKEPTRAADSSPRLNDDGIEGEDISVKYNKFLNKR